jgi:hypothetical protein
MNQRAGPQDERNRAFTLIQYSFNDFSVTIVGWHVRFRTLNDKMDVS